MTNGKEVLPGVDGRSIVGRRYRDIADAITQDQGGAERCAEARIQLIRRFSACAVMAEQIEAKLALGKTIDIAEHAQLTSAMVRVATRIGINRRVRNVTPSLAEYLDKNLDDEIDVDDEETL